MQAKQFETVADEWIAWLVCAAAFTVVGIYIATFARLPLGDPGDWAAFGDYITGTLSPVVGLATVWLVVRTLRITRAEAAETRAELALQTSQLQAQVAHLRDERQRLDVLRKLDGILAEWNGRVERTFVGHLRGPVGLAVVREAERRTIRDILVHHPRADLRATLGDELIGDDLQRALEGLQDLLDEIAGYFDEYEALVEGSTSVTDYYRRRLRYPARTLRELGIVPQDTFRKIRIRRVSTVEVDDAVSATASAGLGSD